MHLNNSRNVLDCLPLLLAIISMVLVEIDPEKFPLVFTRNAERANNNSDLMEETFSSNISGDELVKQKFSEFITKVLMKKTSENFEKTRLETFQEFIKEDLKKTAILGNFVSFIEEENFFHLRIKEEGDLKAMSEILRLKYEEKLKIKNFDERIFLIDNSTADCSPVKFTPFKRQKLSNEYFETMHKGRKLFQVPEDLHPKEDFSKGNPSFNQGGGVTPYSITSRPANSSMVLGDPFKDLDIKELSKVEFFNLENFGICKDDSLYSRYSHG